jgi:hypothetical protein
MSEKIARVSSVCFFSNGESNNVSGMKSDKPSTPFTKKNRNEFFCYNHENHILVSNKGFDNRLEEHFR